MRDKDIKILWGRSGNRCNICKLELTPDGDKETLGEMAHIVAKSSEGPRGNSDMNKFERDEYKNLILLCPTHHSDIDKNSQNWSIEKLLQIKNEHESWVSQQLADGKISIFSIENESFLKGRAVIWKQLCRSHVGVVISLTPLRVSPKVLDSLKEETLQILKQATLPADRALQRVNPNHLRPTEFGAVIERFPELPKRRGHSIHVFDSGHCEYLYELGSSSDLVTETAVSKGNDLKGAKHVIRYTDLAETIDCAIEWLVLMWQKILPLEYMEIRCSIFNTENTTLYSFERSWDGGVFGHPIMSEELVYIDVLTKHINPDELKLDILKWLSRSYGLILDRVLDERKDYARPKPM